ncbi:hypothetical protein LJR034_007621 [Caballeronia sp. LjRoot34]|uniref:hypothetical protein n=1 Tax=Caballeronia sp. LjRoot34 TaxID=3342325 RepID=UPI003ECE97DF
MMHAPLLQTSLPPDEMLSLYFGRLGGLTPHEIRTCGWFAPSGLDVHLAPFRDLIGTFEQVSATNTHLPLQTRVMTPRDIEVYMAHCKTKYKGGILALLGMNGQGSGWATPILASCPECAKVDIAPCGTPFWNRRNLVAGTLYCSSHCRPRETACVNCREYFKDFPERSSCPDKHCGCGLRPLYGTTGLSSSEEAAEIELHRISNLLLDATYRPDIQRDAISWAVSRKATELGLVVNNRTHVGRVADLLSEHPMHSVLQRTRVLADKSSVDDLLLGKRVYANPVQSIGLLSLMHGTWANFEDWLTKKPPALDPIVQPSASPRKLSLLTMRTKASVEKHEARIFAKLCAKYSEMRRRHPDMTHSEIVRPMPHSYASFTSKSRLREAGVDVAPYLRKGNIKDYERIDRSLRAHVRLRAKRLKKDGFPKAITKAVLTRGHEHAGLVGILKGRLPRTQDALKASVEDRTAWRSRLRGLSVSAQRAPKKQQKRETNQEAFSFVQPVADVESVQR